MNERKQNKCLYCGWIWFENAKGNNKGKCPKCHNPFKEEPKIKDKFLKCNK